MVHHCIEISGMGEVRPARMFVASVDEIVANIDICNHEIGVIDTEIAQREIPWPKRVPRQAPSFDVSIRSVRSPEPRPGIHSAVGASERQDAARWWHRLPYMSRSRSVQDFDAVVSGLLKLAAGRPGPIVIVADGKQANCFAQLVQQAGRDPVVLAPGYGQPSPWILPGLLRKPAPGSFLKWLSRGGSERVTEVGAFAFLARESLSTDLAMLEGQTTGLPAIAVPKGALANTRPWAAVDLAGDYDVLPESLSLSKDIERASSKPRISIVTVSYNQAHCLEACLKSVLDQGYENLEYIVVDGGSTDGSLDIIEEYRSQLSAAVIEPDDGQSDALNKGFALATGQVLSWLCSDDLIEPGSLEKIALSYQQHSPDIIFGGCVRIGETRQQELFRHHAAIPFGGPTTLSFPDMLRFMESWHKGHYFYQPEVFFSRRIWEVSGAYLKRHLYYAMDYDLWLRMALAGATAYHLTDMIACSREHAAQKTQEDDRQYLHQI